VDPEQQFAKAAAGEPRLTAGGRGLRRRERCACRFASRTQRCERRILGCDRCARAGVCDFSGAGLADVCVRGGGAAGLGWVQRATV